MSLLLQRIGGRIGGAEHFERLGLHLAALAASLRLTRRPFTWMAEPVVTGRRSSSEKSVMSKTICTERMVEPSLRNHKLHVLVASAGAHPAITSTSLPIMPGE